MPDIIYNVVAQGHGVVDTYPVNKLPLAKEAALDYATRTHIATQVVKHTKKVMFTYTPQPAPPPVES